MKYERESVRGDRGRLEFCVELLALAYVHAISTRLLHAPCLSFEIIIKLDTKQ